MVGNATFIPFLGGYFYASDIEMLSSAGESSNIKDFVVQFEVVFKDLAPEALFWLWDHLFLLDECDVSCNEPLVVEDVEVEGRGLVMPPQVLGCGLRSIAFTLLLPFLVEHLESLCGLFVDRGIRNRLAI